MSVLAPDRSAPAKRLAETKTGTARPLLCFVYSPTSGPSRRAEGFLAQVLQRRKNHRAFIVQRINCVERPDLAKKLGAETAPSLVVVENRRVRARLEGVNGCKNIERLLEPWLGASDEDDATEESLDEEDEDEPGVRLVQLGPGESFDRVSIGLPSGLTFERWRAVGQRISGVADASTWWLADWAAYGEDRYGSRYHAGAGIAGVGQQTLRNYAWVARRFDACRRRNTLSFAHHAEVAALAQSEQEAWLDRAEARQWSRNELRTALREARSALAPDSRTAVARVRIDVPNEHVERWRACAEAGGLDLPEWIIRVADRASGDESLPPPDEATPPTPARVPEPYPPDELDLPAPDPDQGDEEGDE